MQGSGFRVQGAGCRVQGAGFRMQGSGCRVDLFQPTRQRLGQSPETYGRCGGRLGDFIGKEFEPKIFLVMKVTTQHVLDE